MDLQEASKSMQNYKDLGCFPNQMGDAYVWIDIEVMVFWFNLLLMIFLVFEEKFVKSSKSKRLRYQI